ncbi:hypothetical protein [Roseovarius sp. MBR-6]|uniref:hypothetical protein n=1 Tax=Roseovarius sp. MBR-6 TaxID=3156459 RepID=UPI00339489DA
MGDIDTDLAELREAEAKYPIPAWDIERRTARLWGLRLLAPGGVGLEPKPGQPA